MRGEIAAPSPAEVNADRVLLEARRRLARAGLRLQCEVLDDEDGRRWRITLVPPAAGLQVDGLSRARMWLITQGQGHARETIEPIRAGTEIELGEVVLMDVTRFVAVEITEKVTGRSETFSTSLPMDGMPEERDGAILKWVINGRDAFMRYLRLLLSELGDPIGPVLAAQDGAGTCRNPDGGLSFPKTCSRLRFPEMPHRRWRNGTIAHPTRGRLWEAMMID